MGSNKATLRHQQPQIKPPCAFFVWGVIFLNLPQEPMIRIWWRKTSFQQRKSRHHTRRSKIQPDCQRCTSNTAQYYSFLLFSLAPGAWFTLQRPGFGLTQIGDAGDHSQAADELPHSLVVVFFRHQIIQLLKGGFVFPTDQLQEEAKQTTWSGVCLNLRKSREVGRLPQPRHHCSRPDWSQEWSSLVASMGGQHQTRF